MTDNRMTELLPCPFCGGKAQVLKDGLPYVVIECERCFCRTNCNVTEAEAIAAWNTRAERTCRNDSLKRGKGVFVCSECGVYLDIADMDWDGEDDSGGFYEPSYCPNCGRRVIDDRQGE